MKLIKSIVLSSLFIAVIFIAGCNEKPTTSNEPMNNNTQLHKFTLPSGATLVSGTLYIYLESGNYPGPRTVNIFRNTEDWDETIVNWSNRPVYDPTIAGTFSTDGAPVWKIVDITGLVQMWFNCEPNYGLLLDQFEDTQNYETALYSSKEGSNPEYLEIVYSIGGVNQPPVQVPAIADAFIWQGASSGNTAHLETGYVNGYEKQSLVKFDLDCAPPQMQCETAYAFGGSVATCFLDISPRNANNWGWTNLVSPENTYHWPIYAGAGQCDISKGTLVGYLDVSYIGGTLTIDYNIDSGITLNETHVWVGNDKLPTKRGIYQTAPGKFNYNGIDPVVITGLSGNKYIAAHSGVCWVVQ